MLKQKDDEHRKNPETNLQKIIPPFSFPYSKNNTEMLKMKPCDVRAKHTFNQCIYWFVYLNVKLSVTLQKETFSVLAFKFSISLVMKLFHSCWRLHSARCKAPSTPAMSIKKVSSIQGSQDSVYFTRSAKFVKVHLTIYISMIQLR